jgi:hypothetical protein
VWWCCCCRASSSTSSKSTTNSSAHCCSLLTMPLPAVSPCCFHTAAGCPCFLFQGCRQDTKVNIHYYMAWHGCQLERFTTPKVSPPTNNLHLSSQRFLVFQHQFKPQGQKVPPEGSCPVSAQVESGQLAALHGVLLLGPTTAFGINRVKTLPCGGFWPWHPQIARKSSLRHG